MALTKLNNKAVANVTTLPVALGDMILVSSATISIGTASVEFSLGSYKEYVFYFTNIHHSTDGEATFAFQTSTNSGSTYDTTTTSTMFNAYHNEAGDTSGLAYYAGGDQAQGTGLQLLNSGGSGGDNDQALSGYLHLFNPSSTVFVKHYTAVTNCYTDNDQSKVAYTAGYFNTTSALTNIQFKPGRVSLATNFDAGTILMYGIN